MVGLLFFNQLRPNNSYTLCESCYLHFICPSLRLTGSYIGRVGAFPSVDWVEEIGDGQKSGSVGAASGTGTLGRCKVCILIHLLVRLE